jgi:hypothetical protein
MITDEEVYEGERAHIDGFWPGRPSKDFEWTLGPIGERLPSFRVRRVAPVRKEEPWVYATIGVWEATAGERDGLEFFLLSPVESPLHVELLAMVANFHADPRYRLSVGRTINIGRPWIAGSAADHLLVSLPYPYGPTFECCDLGDRHIRFLWLVPVTAAEAQLSKEHGLEALERRFEADGLDMIDPRRRSVA